jgi:CRP/FNR family transcriptional regulator
MSANIGLAEFAAGYPKFHYPKNALILDGNKNINQVYFLESGLVRQYSSSRAGTIFMTHLFRAGAFFPPTAISGSLLNSSYFEAFSPSLIRIIPINDFTSFLKNNPDILMEYVTKLSRHLNMLSQRINLLTGFTAYQRTAATILYLGERIGKKTEPNGNILIDTFMSHKDLGYWVGATRETTSIQMKELQKRGLISYRDRKILIDKWDQLLEETGI